MTWEEVEKCRKKKDANLLVFDSKQVLARVEKMGDIFAPVLTLEQHLPKVAELGSDPESRPRSRRGSTGPDRQAKPKTTQGKKKPGRTRSEATRQAG